MLRLHDNWESGNGYKVRLLLAQLGVPYQRIQYDTHRGETRTVEYLKKNPNGRIPLLEFPDGRLLAESNAILWYLAQGTEFLPNDAFERAEVLQWMFFEQYSHEPYIAVLRNWTHHHKLQEKAASVQEKLTQGHAALQVMEQHLKTRRFFVGDCYSVADIALYAYTHVAPEGGVALDDYPFVRRWLSLMVQQPGHVSLQQAEHG